MLADIEHQKKNSKVCQPKLIYRKPGLFRLNDLRSVTLGVSVAPYPESGGTRTFTAP